MQNSIFPSILQIFLVFVFFSANTSITEAQTPKNIKERKQLLKEAVDTLRQGAIEVGTRQLGYVIRGGLLNPKRIENNKVIQQKLKPQEIQELLYKARLHRDRFLKRKNKDMVALMDTLLERDQKYRMAAYDCIEDEFSNKSKRDSCLQLYQADMQRVDSLNLGILDSIVAEYGWLNESWVGDSDAVWAILAHSNRETKNRYLPLAKAAYLEGELSAERFYLMEDSYLLRHCKTQIHDTHWCTDKETKEQIPCKPTMMRGGEKCEE